MVEKWRLGELSLNKIKINKKGCAVLLAVMNILLVCSLLSFSLAVFHTYYHIAEIVASAA